MTAGIDKLFPSMTINRLPVLHVFECRERDRLERVVKRPLKQRQ